MPEAVVTAAIIKAGSLLVGSGIESHSAGKSRDANLEAQREALDYQKEQDAYERASYEAEQERKRQAWGSYQQAFAPYQQASQGVLAGWGYIQPGGGGEASPAQKMNAAYGGVAPTNPLAGQVPPGADRRPRPRRPRAEIQTPKPGQMFSWGGGY